MKDNVIEEKDWIRNLFRDIDKEYLVNTKLYTVIDALRKEVRDNLPISEKVVEIKKHSILNPYWEFTGDCICWDMVLWQWDKYCSRCGAKILRK